MSKEIIKKASISDFIAKKMKKDEDKNKTLDIKISSMDRTITVFKPSDDEILDYLEDLGDEKSIRKATEETMKLFYRKCPELQNAELHEQLGIKDPYDVLTIFDFKDKNEIMEQFSVFLGKKEKKIDKNLKNS